MERDGVRFRGGKRSNFSSYPDEPAYSHKQRSGPVSNVFGFAAVSLFIFMLRLADIINTTLPDQVAIKEELYEPDRFIGERAESHLKRLTEIGTKVVGSYENEVLAVDLLKREITFIIQQSEPAHSIEMDIQRPTGSYYLLLKPYGFRNYYANIQNIVVKIGPHHNKSAHSVLVNCHYDTVPESPGASDNGLNCAVMLEVLRKLSYSKKPLPNNVIFLFNGAEENPLQASHGFITQHKWSKEVRVVVNLDSAGAGGKEVLFQTSSQFPWLVKAYAKSVPHPSGGVHGEELFQSGVIPSDTDFRVFRDFGPTPGLDLAHSDNGYIYHTKLDKMDYISPGVYQHTGDNILALVKELISSPELSQMDKGEKSQTKVIYFDVFGLFMVVYTETYAVILNVLSVIFSIYTVYKTFSLISDNPSKSLFITTGMQLFGWLITGAMLILVSKTLDAFNASMSWYAHPWYVIPIYAFPLVFTSAFLPILSKFFDNSGENLSQKAIRYICSSQLLWSIVLLIGTLSGIRTSFIVMLFVLFPTVGSAFAVHSRTNFTAKKFFIAHFLSSLFPIMWLLCQAVRTFGVLIPMTARMGPQANPELVIAILTILFGILSTSYVIPLALLLKKPRNLLATLCGVHFLTMVLIIGTPLGFPYDGDLSDPALQRFYVFHGERTFHDQKGEVRRSDSGFFVQGLDRNNLNYVSELVPELKSANRASSDCEKEIYCGVPIFTSRFINPAPHSFWVPSIPPLIHHPTTLEVVSQKQITVRSRRLHILVTGPDHITITMSLREGVKLLKWSFDEFEPLEAAPWQGRQTYMVYFSHGVVGATLEFDLDLEVSKEFPEALLDVAVVGHYMHDQAYRTDEFQNFLAKFPDWAHVTPWTVTYKSWVI